MSMRERVSRFVPGEREVIFRAGGRVRYLRLGRTSQIVMLAVAAVAVGWSAYATVLFSAHEEIVSARNTKIYALQDEKAALADDVTRLRNRLEIQEKSLTATQKSTVDLLADNQDLQFEIAGLEQKLVDEIERGRSVALSYLGEVEAHARDEEARERLEVTEAALRSKLADRDAYLAAIDAERTRLDTQIAASREELKGLRIEVGTLQAARADLVDRLSKTQIELASTEEQKEEIAAEREALDTQVASLSARLESIEDAHGDIVARLEEQTNESGEALKRTLSIAGLDVDRLLDRLARSEEGKSAVGGPLLPV